MAFSKKIGCLTYCVDADTHIDGILDEFSCSGENFDHLKGHHDYVVCFFGWISLFMVGVPDNDIAITNRVDLEHLMNLAFLIKFSENRSEHLNHRFWLILIRITRESCNICEQNRLFFKLF